MRGFGELEAAIMDRFWVRGEPATVREILGDLTTSANVGEVAEKANRRRPRWHRLPYGVPLCIGFVGYLLWLHGG